MVKSYTTSSLWDFAYLSSGKLWALQRKRYRGIIIRAESRGALLFASRKKDTLQCQSGNCRLTKSSHGQIMASLAGHVFKADIWFWGSYCSVQLLFGLIQICAKSIDINIGHVRLACSVLYMWCHWLQFILINSNLLKASILTASRVIFTSPDYRQIWEITEKFPPK